MFPALILVFIFVPGSATGVAPEDEGPLCEHLRALGAAPIPAYSANMRVLMDSWNYQNLLPADRTGAVWDQVDNDGNNPSGTTTNWIQQSNTPCWQTVQVCGFTAGPQNNWLIIQLINRTVNGTRLSQVSVMIELELRGCDITLNCQRTFNTYIYETSFENSTRAATSVDNYQEVQRISLVDTFGNRVNETITVNFKTNYSSFYFAIQDVTSCIVITRLIIFYYVCPAQTASLIYYPETIAPFSFYEGSLPNISVSATCIENAEPDNGLAPMVTCAAGGIWESITPGVACHCVQGYFRGISPELNESETCNFCPAGTYLSPSNNSCLACPANSVSEEEGLTQCTCVEGYYRAAQGEEDLPCTYQESNRESVSSGRSNSTLITESNQTVLLAAILPLVLVGIALSTALITLALLIYIRANIKKNNLARKESNHDEPKVTKEEVYYSTADLKTCAANPQMLKMEKNCAYGEVVY